MKRIIGLVLLFVALFALAVVSCSEEKESSQPMAGDTDGDTDDDGPPIGGECEFASDCADSQDCVNGKCANSERCYYTDDCEMEHQICWYAQRGDPYGHCREFCTTDMDCAENSHCLDGLCEPYEPIPEGTPPPEHPEWSGKLHAAYAEGFLEFPMTTTMGGYGARKGPKGPYQAAMGGSSGVYDRAMVRVISLDDGSDRAVFVRLPMIFPTDFLVTGIVKQVMELGGPDLRENLILTASHSHSGPARFWNILPDLGFGALGMSDFSLEIYIRIVNSISQVIYEANLEENFKPAKFGYGINPDFDPYDLINRDRRGENDPFKDPRLIVWRIDDLSSGSSEPWIVTLSYATHGTIEDYDDTFLTDDAPGGAENMTRLLWEKENPGKKINAVFFQGMAGDISPAGGFLGHNHGAKSQLIGAYVYTLVMELYNSMVMTDELDIKVVSKRVPIDRDYIGYTDDEFWSDATSPGEQAAPRPGPHRFGAFQCGLMNNIVEENLDLYAYDGSDNELAKSNWVRREHEQVMFTAETQGSYYFKVEGYRGCMNRDYSLSVTINSQSDPSACIDAECGQTCGACTDRKEMAPITCDDDFYDNDGSGNDTKTSATPVDNISKIENLEICPFDEDWFSLTLDADDQVIVAIDFAQDDGRYNPHTRLPEGNFGCALIVEAMNGGPIPQFGKTRFTGIVLDDKVNENRKLYLAGLPGEPTSRMGLDTVNEVQAATDFDDVIVFGFTNDHHFYITTEDDWYQAGYNTEMSIWGPQFGPFCIKHLKDLAVALSEGAEETAANEFPNMKPANFSNLTDDTRIPETTPGPSDNPPAFDPLVHQPIQILDQPQDTVKMEEQTAVRWIGGDPGVDFPRIYLERKNGETFDTVYRNDDETAGRIYDDRYYEMRLEYENRHFNFPNDPDADVNNYWTLTWEETYSFQPGGYRFRIEGRYYDGPTDHFDKENGVKAYTLYSGPFDILPTRFEVQQLSVAEGKIGGSLRYARPICNDTGENAFENIQSYALVLHSKEVESYTGPRAHADPDITTVAISITGGDLSEAVNIDTIDWEETFGVVTYVYSRDGEGNEDIRNSRAITDRPQPPVSLFSADLPSLNAGAYTASLAFSDIWGNTGSAEIDFNIE